MFLNESDLKKFDEDGYLFFPEMFSKDEASLLKRKQKKFIHKIEKKFGKKVLELHVQHLLLINIMKLLED